MNHHAISGEMYVVDFEIDGDAFLVIKYVKREEKNTTLRLVSYSNQLGPFKKSIIFRWFWKSN